MEDLLERQTHALFISGGRLNATNAPQSGEENCPRLPEIGADGSFDRRTGEPETHENKYHQDLYPNLKASLLRHAVGTSDRVGNEEMDSGETVSVLHSRASRLGAGLSNNRPSSSSSRWPLSRWGEARLYQRKTGLGLVGAHKMTLKAFKHRRSSDKLSSDLAANPKQLHKACSTYPRYSRTQHQRFKNQQHSFSRALYTNRSRARRLNDHSSSEYSSKRSGFPVFGDSSSTISGYYYPSDESRAKEVAINDSDENEDASEPGALGADTFWHFDPSLKHKEFACSQYDPHDEGLAIRDNEDEAYYMRRKSTAALSSGHVETGGAGEDDEETMTMKDIRQACSAATQRIKAIRSSRQARHHTSHGLARNSRRRHFGHEPAHRRRLCQLKSRRSRKLIMSVALDTTGQSQRCQQDQPSETADRLLSVDQSHETGTSLAVSHPDHAQNRSGAEAANRLRHHNQGPPRLSRLRARSESTYTPNEQPPQHTPVLGSVSPTEAKYEPTCSVMTTSTGVPTAVPGNLPRNRLRPLGEHRDKSRTNDDESDSAASPDERLYCLCRKVSFGDMIACDNKRCELEWFHFACVDIRVQPKGKWFCPFCRGENSKTRRTDS